MSYELRSSAYPLSQHLDEGALISRKRTSRQLFGALPSEDGSSSRPMSCLAVTFMAQQINSLKQEP